jgi:hypothetical protein
MSILPNVSRLFGRKGRGEGFFEAFARLFKAIPARDLRHKKQAPPSLSSGRRRKKLENKPVAAEPFQTSAV